MTNTPSSMIEFLNIVWKVFLFKKKPESPAKPAGARRKCLRFCRFRLNKKRGKRRRTPGNVLVHGYAGPPPSSFLHTEQICDNTEVEKKSGPIRQTTPKFKTRRIHTSIGFHHSAKYFFMHRCLLAERTQRWEMA